MFSEIAFDYEPELSIPKAILYADQEQQETLEVTFKCRDGIQKCSRWILGFSDFFREKLVGFDRLGNPMVFDYTKYTKACIKSYLDCLHQISGLSFSAMVTLQVMTFLADEGKIGKQTKFYSELIYRGC